MKIVNVFKRSMALTVLIGGLAHAQPIPASAPGTSAKLTEGEVRKIDLATSKVTLRHGPIENLGMPGMTMMFKVTEPKSLENFKEGDKVRFRAERAGGTIVVSHIEAAG